MCTCRRTNTCVRVEGQIHVHTNHPYSQIPMEKAMPRERQYIIAISPSLMLTSLQFDVDPLTSKNIQRRC
jgi:hypothetical protein